MTFWRRRKDRGNERRKTTDGAGRGGIASDVSIWPYILHQLCLQLSEAAVMISSGFHRVSHTDTMVDLTATVAIVERTDLLHTFKPPTQP